MDPERYEADDESFEYDVEADDEDFAEAPAPRWTRGTSPAMQRLRQQLLTGLPRPPQPRSMPMPVPVRVRPPRRRRRPARRRRQVPLHPVPGSAIVVATLPNGRETRMRITPAPASARAVDRLRAEIAAGDKRQTRALASNAKAIRQLGAIQAKAFAKITAAQLATDKARTKRVLDGDAKLDGRVTKEIGKVHGEQRKHRRVATAMLKRQRRRALWDSILLASGMPFFSAFGDEKNPVSRDNLVLTASMAGWLVGDEFLDTLVRGKGRAAKRNRVTAKRGADLWSYAAPIGNAATVWFLLKDRQHSHFVTGITPVLPGSTVTVPIEVASAFEKDFAKRSDVPAVATIVSGPPSVRGVTARVVAGSLELEVFGTGGLTQVAWMVDTRELGR